jgi:hypothetical protein
LYQFLELNLIILKLSKVDLQTLTHRNCEGLLRFPKEAWMAPKIDVKVKIAAPVKTY